MSSHADARPDRPVAAPVLEFRLDEQVERLRREPAWRSGTRDAITLAKGPVLRVVLTVHRAGLPFTPVEFARCRALAQVACSLEARSPAEGPGHR